jgi:hypothetical protein
LGRIKAVDVVLPTSCGMEIRRRCVSRPTDHQAILLQRAWLYIADKPADDGQENKSDVV